MSMQSDIEFLSIQAMELYAERKNLSPDEVLNLFQNAQIFEKMILQYEYLHQVDSEEMLEYISQLISEDNRQLVLHHGTVHLFEEIDLNKSHNRRDFGKGFYTTILMEQAKEWAYRLKLRTRAESYYVYQYLFTESPELKIKRFHALDKEWLEFIKENRSKGDVQHQYDIVIGPVADDNTMETVQLYISGILKAEEAVERLRYSKVNNQVSFHTDKALSCLQLIGRDIYA